MKTQQQFIIDTLLPYKQDPTTRALDSRGLCVYLDNQGNKCALGKHLKQGEWQYDEGDVTYLNDEYNLNSILTDEAKEQNLSIKDWANIQVYHDTMVDNKNESNAALKRLEEDLNIDLKVLYLE